MATQTVNMSTYSARILAHTPDDTSYFLRGDNTFTNILSSADSETSFTIQNSISGIELSLKIDNTNLIHGLYSSGAYDGTETTIDDGKWLIQRNSDGSVDMNGNATSATCLKDKTDGTASFLNYGQAGITTGSGFTWIGVWDGYTLVAASKAAMAEAVDSSHKWVRLGGDTMTGALTCNSGIVCGHGVNFMVGGNEVNFIPDGYSNTFWFNYETYNRKNNGSVTQYIFGNGHHGSLASITSGHISATAEVNVNGTNRTMQIRTGRTAASHTTNTSHSFSPAFSNACVQVVACCGQQGFDSVSTISVGSISRTGFQTWLRDNASASMWINWIAIGY